MANWLNKMDLKQFVDEYEDDKITIEECAQKIAKYLHEFVLQPPTIQEQYQFELEEIALEFEAVTDVEEFDDALERLYDLGDTAVGGRLHMQDKIAWIKAAF